MQDIRLHVPIAIGKACQDLLNNTNVKVFVRNCF